ncbi:MAG: TRAP transporter small permease [Deltaproteobacteria bacterium]|nr:TRAP transporter small permease [Deltaproteobacteria bacterium]NQT55243.1 TRAP transporter small permease [Desulfobacteraceae bacterium]
MDFLLKTGRILDRVMEGFVWLAGLLMMFSLITVCIDVVMRYFFNNPIGWVLQFSEYILLYIPFLAAAFVLREESHIKIDIVLNRLNQKTQSLINVVTSLLGFCVLIVLTYYGTYVTFDFYQRKVPTLKYLKIPEFLVLIVIPIGCFLFAIQFIRRAYRYYKTLEAEKGKEG